MKNKIIKIIVLLSILLIGIQMNSQAYFEENTETIRNPDRGFYKLIQVKLQKNSEDFSKFKDQINDIIKNDPDVSLISFQLNLEEYVSNNDELPQSKLKEINQYFSIMRENGYQVIFRVVYESEGNKNPEPDFQTILRHIEELKPVDEENEDIIFVVEAGFLGSYGEWHDGKYDDDEEKRKEIIDKLLECIPESIQINLRKPSFIREYIGDNKTVTEQNAFSNEKIARLGLHNDGYLASETDLGTYKKLERTAELVWQGKQTTYTIFGGECQNKNSTYTNLDNAILDMKQRHCTYLNKTYDREVKEKWKESTYINANSKYNGDTGYKYVQDHLGYRLIIKNVDISCEHTTVNINLKLENVGFGNIVRKKQLQIILKNDKKQYFIATDIDIRQQLNVNTYNLTIREALPEQISTGEYKVFLKIQEPYQSLKNNSNYCIKLANSGIWNEELGANYIGNIIIPNKESNNILLKVAVCIAIITLFILLIKLIKKI